MHSKLLSTIAKLDVTNIMEDRKLVLQPLIDYVRQRLASGLDVRLNFICTHNSRRSQLSQAWASVLAAHYELPIRAFSGGTEVTACYTSTIAALVDAGFSHTVEHEDSDNPVYVLTYQEGAPPIRLFSKLYNHQANPQTEFAAVMTCDNAQQSCPAIPEATVIPVLYEDPKVADGTSEELARYCERSQQIATELSYVFATAKTALA